MPPSATETMHATAVSTAAAPTPAPTPHRAAQPPTPRGQRWARLVRLLTDPREARAELHALDLGSMRSTWT